MGHNGNSHKVKTTKGYKFLVLLKNGSTDWIPLKDKYSSNPLETDEFVVVCQLQDEPAFAWWVDNILKTRNCIINKIKFRYWKQEYKFSILLPKNVDNKFGIDIMNDNNFWRMAIEKELETVCVAYKSHKHNKKDISLEQIRSDRQKHLIGYKETTCHFVSDVKLDESFTRKAYFLCKWK